MDIGKTLYVTDRQAWRKWLAENYDKEKEIWLIYPKKASGKPRILYNDAVEEALSFGWIDSTAKKLMKKVMPNASLPETQKRLIQNLTSSG